MEVALCTSDEVIGELRMFPVFNRLASALSVG